MVSLTILPAKRLLQDLCTQGLSWDEEIRRDESQCWRLWLSDLPLLSSVALPRCLRLVDFSQIQNAELHHFVDTSQITYTRTGQYLMQDLSMRAAAFIAVSLLEISLSSHESDDYTQIRVVSCRFDHQNESDLTRGIPPKVQQDGILEGYYSHSPIYQE